MPRIDPPLAQPSGAGDILIGNAAGRWQTLTRGGAGQALTVDASGLLVWSPTLSEDAIASKADQAALTALTPTTEGRVMVKGPTVLRQERREWLDPTAEGVVIEAVPTATVDHVKETNNTTVLNQMLGYAASRERDLWIPGKVAINGSVDLVGEVVMRGRGSPKYATAVADQKGSGLFWVGGTTGTLINWGKRDQTVDVVGTQLENLILDGGSQAGVTLISLRSNTPTNSAYVTRRGLMRNLVLTKSGIGIQWGNASNEVGYNEEQSDFFYLTQLDFYNLSVHGVVIDGANTADNTTFDTLTFYNAAPAGQSYIEVIRGGYMSFVGVDGGGDGQNSKTLFHFGTLSTSFRVEECQSEKMYAFMSVDGNDDKRVIELNHNTINDDVYINGVRRIEGNDNIWAGGRLFLNASGAKYEGKGDAFYDSMGSRVIAVAGAQFENKRLASASPLEYINAGTRITSAIPPTSGVGAYEEVVVRTGRRATTWAAGVTYTQNGGGVRTWMPGETIVAGDQRIPTVPNGYVYVAGNGGTTGSTEPGFYLVGPTLDNGITWTIFGAMAALQFISDPIDNGHVYRVLQPGVAGATKPTLPVSAGATVADGTAILQESGPSGLAIPQQLVPTVVAGAAPTTGYFKRSTVAWNSGFTAGGPAFWINGSDGNPGAWSAVIAPVLRTKTTTPVAISQADTLSIINMAVASAVTVNLPSNALSAIPYIIKDGKGDAATNNITVAAPSGKTIDGSASIIINTNRGFVTLVADTNNNFYIVAKG